MNTIKQENKGVLAYIVGAAIGDGNLSNPNGRATRLRITCDIKYQNIIKRMRAAIRKIFPDNKVSLVKRKENCLDISCYSNKWENLLGWKAFGGSKYNQNVSVPKWIKKKRNFSIACLRGLLETDGSIYIDRGYKMVNFTTIIPTLATDTMTMIGNLGFEAHIYKIPSKNKKARYNIRISKNTDKFIKLINFKKD